MPVHTMSDQIKRFILQTFPLARTRRISCDDHLLESGILDSLGVLDLIAFIEQEFLINVSDEDLLPENFQTINRLTAFVEAKRNGAVEQRSEA